MASCSAALSSQEQEPLGLSSAPWAGEKKLSPSESHDISDISVITDRTYQVG